MLLFYVVVPKYVAIFHIPTEILNHSLYFLYKFYGFGMLMVIEWNSKSINHKP
jgi:hypothetical protein